MAFGPSQPNARGQFYYDNVILPDERRFLLSEAKAHMLVVEPGTVIGDRTVFIQDGKPMIGYEQVMEQWTGWEGYKKVDLELARGTT